MSNKITKDTIQALRTQLAEAYLDSARAQHEWDVALFSAMNMQAPASQEPEAIYHVPLELLATDAALSSEACSLEGLIVSYREQAAAHRARTATFKAKQS
jgi:hypothetical protein